MIFYIFYCRISNAIYLPAEILWITLQQISSMTTQIITEDLGDGYYHHQLNISTYYYVETIISPVALRESRAGKNTSSIVKSNFGRFEQYRLSQYISEEDLLKHKGEIVKLASVENGKIISNPQAIAIFNQYPDNEIAFVGNYGRRQAGKSFWYDKILNLSDFDGNNYSVKREPGLYIWSVPYTKDNLKFFLIDNAGFEAKEQLSPDEQKLLDFELLLCEKLVIIPEPNDEELTVLRPAYNHLLDSQRRFSDKNIQANKFSPYWPNEVYTLYRSSRPVKKQIDNIGILFSVYNFSIIHDALDPQKSTKKQDLLKTNLNDNSDPLNEKYVKMTSVVFRDIFDKMKGKQYGDVKCTGKNLPFVLQKSMESINNGKGVKIDQISDGVKDNIYDKAVEKCKAIYLKEVNPLRESKDPKPIDVLTDTFDRGSIKAFRQFDREVLDKKIHQQYESKLQDQINKIQEEILQENKKKTYNFYNSKLPIDQEGKPDEYINKLKQNFKDQKKSTMLDHNDLQPIKERLEETLINQSEIILLPQNDVKRYNDLKKLLNSKKKQLESIKTQKMSLKNHRNPEQLELVDKHQVLTIKSQLLKQEIEQKKELNELTPQQKGLFLTTLRQTHKKNEQALSSIKNTTPSDEQILGIKDKLRKAAQKNSLIQNGLSNVDKTFLEKSNLSNRLNRSVIRDIKSQNIKKITIK